ncbi:hypothetical protein INQ48_37180 (plasmid) [Variovorax paradoxus]|uniref:hypothetical protein n=1 Tax=Variovorax sp. UC122_21 TaxID=3374554 RepID=UPI0019318FDB|nr:hypothetical protein INQ48_37180 [Variovorax paradoxus]
MSRNIAASIRARLKQHADARKQDFNLTLNFDVEKRIEVSEPLAQAVADLQSLLQPNRCGTLSMLKSSSLVAEVWTPIFRSNGSATVPSGPSTLSILTKCRIVDPAAEDWPIAGNRLRLERGGRRQLHSNSVTSGGCAPESVLAKNTTQGRQCELAAITPNAKAASTKRTRERAPASKTR